MGSTKDIEFSAIIEPDGAITYEYDRELHASVPSFVRHETEGGATAGATAPAPTGESLNAEAVASQIARALAPQLRKILRPTQVPPDDAFVDQDEGLYPREVYLQLARKGYFTVTKEGNARVARWGDVKAGFAKAGRTDITVVTQTDDPEADLLNAIRQRAGLQVRGGR